MGLQEKCSLLEGCPLTKAKNPGWNSQGQQENILETSKEHFCFCLSFFYDNFFSLWPCLASDCCSSWDYSHELLCLVT